MTHDPLCPYAPERPGFGGLQSGVGSTQPFIPSVPCQCDLIGKVRRDERSLVKSPLVRAMNAIMTQLGMQP